MRRWVVAVLVGLGLSLALAAPVGAIPNNKNTFTLNATCSGFGDVQLVVGRGNINGAVHVVGGGRFKVVEIRGSGGGESFTERSNYPKAPNTTCRGSISDEFGTFNFEVTGALRLR